MMHVSKILLRGVSKADAVVEFGTGSNVLAGDSDTGKSYLVHCLNYILGADEMEKRIPKAEGYSQLFVEFHNTEGAVLTLERNLSGGQLEAHDVPIDDITEAGRVVLSKRAPRGDAADVTTVLFSFAGIAEAQLRKNSDGEVQRLTVRTMLPIFLVDEVSIIDDRSSPVTSTGGFDVTARKRMLSYLLTGKDDTGVIVAEKGEIVRVRAAARLSVIEDLLTPLEQRLKEQSSEEADESTDRLDETITSLTRSLDETSDERMSLEEDRRQAITTRQRAESQLLAINEMLARYRLLDERYRSDLERLDFVAEGAHFFDGLQEVRCPLCDQLLTGDHVHTARERGATVYEAAKAEAGKILALQKDLSGAIESLNRRHEQRLQELSTSTQTITKADGRIATILAPNAKSISERLDRLVDRRVRMEAARKDHDQIQALRTLKDELEKTPEASKTKWEPLPSAALLRFCQEVEGVLKEWNWSENPRVEFDEGKYDIIVDGQARRSHGKGVRGVLYAAFSIGLLRYCATNKLPHPGLVILDSPLTAYKKGKAATTSTEKPVDAGIEASFWSSLKNSLHGTQIIIIENKEPPSEVAAALQYQWFAGENALPSERRGFIPD